MYVSIYIVAFKSISSTNFKILLNSECPECIPAHSNYSLKHIFIVCVDVVESRQTYYNVNNLSDFVYECRIWKFVEEIDLNATI
jgi:hypothetical protein